jgi:glutaredoxin 3
MSLAALSVSKRVVIFSWVQCPYCVRAKELFAGLTKDVVAYDIDKMPEGGAIKAEIEKQFNHDTVPAVFIKGKFVGGFSDCNALHQQGKLVPMLSD